MTNLAPAFAAEIAREIEIFEWHPRAGAGAAARELRDLPPDINEKAGRLAKKYGLDISAILLQALRAGLDVFSSGPPSADLQALVKRQTAVAREVYDEHQSKQHRKRPRSKIA